MLGAFGGALLVAIAACSIDTSDAGSTDGTTPTGNGSTTSSGGGASSSSSGGTEITATGLPCDVSNVLKTRCQTCHASEPKYGASAPLVTWDDLQKPAPGGGKKVYEAVKERIHNDQRPMPPSPQPRLDAKEMGAIDAWIAGGARPSDARCETPKPTGDDGVKPLSCKPDQFLKSKVPFELKEGDPTDQYICFAVDINLTKKRHVIAAAPMVDNKQILHHILLFQTDRQESTDPFPCKDLGSGGWKLYGGWAPGGDNLELPPEAGIPEEKGTTHWMLQIHYNSAVAKTGKDNSGYGFCTTEDLRPNDAGVLAFGSMRFAIPPRSTYTQRCDYRLGSQFKNTKIFNMSPHMHQMGAAMSSERIPGGNGQPEMIYEQKNFSFEAQGNYPVQKEIKAGDVIRTRCSWKNTSDKTIGWGENTGDEMCYHFAGYYPNIRDVSPAGLPLFTWVTPSLNANCADE